MRLVRLSVQRFQCIESAELELSAGLNVLYGPNDLGKSSLAWAIRAVLLLQHGAALHERFVSWYGGGEPRVALTLCDREGRYWRVTKSFGTGGAGRSTLESSKDGRSFMAECSGRQVDEKLRAMIGWGLSAPGGQGPRGLPDSFLTQVLLAEQDNVRKVLFGSSLTDDPDESGRLRLTQALGALAQDPIFKQVLEETQIHVDQAFTSKGRKKRSAGSPFIELAERIKEMQRERDELESKVRETAAAEDKIRVLNGERERLQNEIEDATLALRAAEAQDAAKLRRDDLETQLATQSAAVKSIEDVQRQIDRAQVELSQLQADAAASNAQLTAAIEELAREELSRDQARARLDALSHEDLHTQQQTSDLEARLQAAQDQLLEAERAHERAADALRQARELANGVAIAVTAARQRDGAAHLARETLDRAVSNLVRVEQALEAARQRLRDATSGDRAQARALARKELENRRLNRSAQRATSEQALRRAQEVGGAIAKASEATKAEGELAKQVKRANAQVSEDQVALDAIEATIAVDRNLGVLGALVQARAAVSTARAAAATADSLRAQASRLREEATALRLTLRGDVPSMAAVTALRALRDEERLAEARLGGGLSITVRPRRAVAMQTTRDGIADPPLTTAEASTVSASRTIALHIDELVDIEVTAGEASARQAAAELRSRWDREGASTLRSLGVHTVEELDDLCRRHEAASRVVDEKNREADHAELRATREASASGVLALAAAVASLEAELHGAEADLLPVLKQLGESWAAALKQRAADTERSRHACASLLDRHRAELTRLETQLEAMSAETARLVQDASARQAELGGLWSALEAQHRAEVGQSDLALVEIDRQLEAMSGAATDEEGAARAAVAAGATDLATATTHRDRAQLDAQQARDAAIAASTTLDSVRTRARVLDANHIWEAALQASSALEIAPWLTAAATVEAHRDALRRQKMELRAQLERIALERTTAISAARATAESAEARVRATRTRCDLLQQGLRTLAEQRDQTQAALAEMRVQVAGSNNDAIRQSIAALRLEIASLQTAIGNFDVQVLERRRDAARRLESQLRDVEEERAKASGALEQVGGAIARERQHELTRALQELLDQEHALEVEFDAWKLLLDTLRASESSEGAHLGRALADPVSGRFRQLTGGRYGHLELGAHLEATGLEAAGAIRSIGALSAGTQDQLATLLRLCVAEQLHSAIVLDDHLSQSDPARVAWFNTVLRNSAQQIQIVLITCRPTEILSAAEFPVPGESTLSGAGGLVRAVDLSMVIKRFAPMSAPPPGKVNSSTAPITLAP